MAVIRIPLLFDVLARPAEWHVAAERMNRVSKRQPSLCHHLDEISQAEFVAQIPAHAKNDHVAVKVTPCE